MRLMSQASIASPCWPVGRLLLATDGFSAGLRVASYIIHPSRPVNARQGGVSAQRLNFTLRNSMYHPSASTPTCPLGTSQAFQLAVTAPLIHKVICLPLQATS